MDSKQLTILKALTAHLRGITPSAGYDFDMSTSVFRGRAMYGENDPVPMISIIESLDPDNSIDVANESRTVRSETWVLLVQGFIEAPTENPTDHAYNLKAAVEHRLAQIVAVDQFGDGMYPDYHMLGGLITDLSIGPGVVSGPRRELSSDLAFFYLPVGVGLAVDVANPFTDPFVYISSASATAGGTSDAEAESL